MVANGNPPAAQRVYNSSVSSAKIMRRALIVGLACAAAAAAQVGVAGRVIDEDGAPVPAARVAVHCGALPAIEAQTGPAGLFQMSLPPGDCTLNAGHAGFFELRDRPLHIGNGPTEVTVTLNPQHEVFQSVTVGALPPPVDPAETQGEQRLSGTEVDDIPYPASHSLRNAMKLMPGVVQDPTGGLHFQGGAEYQTRYTLDGFDITDPIDGRYSTRLAVEGVRSLDLVDSRESANLGNGSAGTLAIHPENGADQFHSTATNFIPGLDIHSGVRFGDWTPRAGVSGPIVKGRAWFSDSFDGEYNSGYVSGLPNGQNTNPTWVAGNLLHAQVNLTPTNILFADLLADFDHQAHNGLGVLDPISTTTALSDRQWLAAVKESHAWAGGAAVETGFAWRLSGLGVLDPVSSTAAVSDRQWLAAVKESHAWAGGAVVETGFAWQSVDRDRTPQGGLPYLVAPAGRSGDYFVRSREHGRRDQLFVNYFPRVRHFAGRHQLQLGADAQRLDYTAQFQRTTYELLSLTGQPLFQTTFQGGGSFNRPGASVATYITDHWQPATRLAIDCGVREDWNELVRHVAISPRIAVSYAPFADARDRKSVV